MEVVTQDRKYEFDKVIVAVPLGVMKKEKIKFNPEIPEMYRISM